MKAITSKFHLTPFSVWLGILVLFMALGAVAGIFILTKGLYLTNLTDLIPWGLWITIDLSSIALSAGAFLLCAAVYILGLKRYQPVARTATFIGLVGYSMALLCLLMDIGRPDRFWHALVFWNPHSVLWEVTMCVALYFTVLTLETAPIFANFSWFKRRYPALSLRMANLHHYAPYLAIIGLGLSMLHQSSLGATYGVLKARPIWYRPDLSVLFMVSAMAGGPALTVLVSMLAARFYSRVKIDDHILERVSYFIGWVLVGYLYFRFWEAMSMNYTYHPGRTEGLQLLTKGPLAFNFWVLEVILGMVLPIVLLQVKRYRQQPLLRMVALGLVVIGVIAYRWDVNLAGQLVLLTYLPQEIVTRYTTYIPSITETLIGLGIMAYGMMAVTLGVRYLNIVDHTPNLVEEYEPRAVAVVGD